MELFKQIDLGFDKTASAKNLSDNTEVWPSEILASLYKQHQFLGGYEVNLQIDGQEENLGFLYGSFQVKNAGSTVATQHQGMSQGMVTKQPQPEASTARIPVIVTDGKLHSFDVFIRPDASFSPLDQGRLEEALFEPSGYTAVSPHEATADAGAVSGSMQPEAPSYGRVPTGGQKLASVLEKAASSVPQEVRESFVKSAEAHPLVKRAIATSTKFASALHTIASADFVEPPDEQVDAAILQKIAGGYTLTYATSDAFNPKTVQVSNVEAQSFPKEAVDACLAHGVALFTYAPASDAETVTHFGEELVDVTESGVYALMEKDGSATRGAVITDVVGLDGRTTSLNFALTPTGASFQEKVAGVRCGDIELSRIAGSIPFGDGVFLLKEGSVTEPISIKHKIETPEDTTYVYEDGFGRVGQLKLADVHKIVQIEGRDYLLPADARFIPTIASSGVMSDPVTIDKVANASDLAREVTVVADGGLYSFRGSFVDDLDYEETNFVKESTALLLTGLLGASPEAARGLLKLAADGSRAKFIAKRSLTPASATKVATSSEDFENFVHGLRANLIKEAAAIAPAAEETLDSVLSLNFITPENVQGFMEALPRYEESLASLAELLIAVRVGVPDVPEAAVLSCIKSLTRTIDGLNKLGLRQEAQA